MSRYGFASCSCGSSILKPTLRPPPSLQPRFAASITPGPPPVITAQPASPKSFAVARAAAYSDESSPIRADPRREHADHEQRREADVQADDHQRARTVGRECRNRDAGLELDARHAPL